MWLALMADGLWCWGADKKKTFPREKKNNFRWWWWGDFHWWIDADDEFCAWKWLKSFEIFFGPPPRQPSWNFPLPNRKNRKTADDSECTAACDLFVFQREVDQSIDPSFFYPRLSVLCFAFPLRFYSPSHTHTDTKPFRWWWPGPSLYRFAWAQFFLKKGNQNFAQGFPSTQDNRRPKKSTTLHRVDWKISKRREEWNAQKDHLFYLLVLTGSWPRRERKKKKTLLPGIITSTSEQTTTGKKKLFFSTLEKIQRLPTTLTGS